MLPQLISLWPSEHTGTTWLPVEGGGDFPVLSTSKGGRGAGEGENTGGHRGTKTRLCITFSLGADTEREGECLLILVTHIL